MTGLLAPPARVPGRADRVATRIDGVLAAFIDTRCETLAEVGPELAAVTATARGFVLDGGKRLRSRFAYWGWRSVNDAGADDAGFLPAATSLELLHACALVHDDVMDDSATRRGRCSVHERFAALHRANGWCDDARRFGTTAAILVGDLLLVWADGLFATARPAAAAATRAEYDRMREFVVAGQYLDLLARSRGGFGAEQALRVARFKTTTYTVEGPLRLGAAAAGAPAPVFDALGAYATALGEAFQLRDDVLGVFGDPARTGKPVGDDLREGKRTLLVALAVRGASRAQARALRCALGDRALSDADVAALRELIVRTGALAGVEARIARRTAQAREALRTPAITGDARDALDALALASTDRQT